MKRKDQYKLILFSSILIGFLIVYLIYHLNLSVIRESYNEIHGMDLVVIIMLIRITILFGNAMYMLYKWFKQEEQYLSDIPFLFALFFILLTIGKAFDLFFNFTYRYFSESLNLVVIKLRFFIIIFTVLPLIYLSITMILYYLSLRAKFQKLGDEKFKNKVSLILVLIILMVESIAVIIVPNTSSISILLPAVVIPSLLVIIWLFAFSYKNKRLSQVNSFILMIGFGLYLISQIIRPIIQNIVGENTFYINIVEIIDLIIFIVIFIGFYLEAKYEIE